MICYRQGSDGSMTRETRKTIGSDGSMTRETRKTIGSDGSMTRETRKTIGSDGSMTRETRKTIGSDGSMTRETRKTIGSDGSMTRETRKTIGSDGSMTRETRKTIGSDGSMTRETRKTIGSDGSMTRETRKTIGSDGSMTRETRKTIGSDGSMTRETRKTMVIGILSAASNVCWREAQRRMFITKAREYQPLDIKVFFLLDGSTPELDEENRVNQDIVFLNSTIHGWRGFAGKLHKWLRYAVKNFPNAVLIGRMDDDVFTCVPQIFDRLNKLKHELLYYGYPTAGPRACPTQECVDEMFLVIGVELARRIADRNMCEVKEEAHCLTDGNAGHLFRRWIQLYDDFVFINERANGKMVFFYRGTPLAIKRELTKHKTANFCKTFLLYHKANVSELYTMHRDNNLLLGDTQFADIANNLLIKKGACPNYTKLGQL